MYFLLWLSTHNSPCPESSGPFLKSAVMAIMVVVSQHEEISTCAPHFCVAHQAPHTVARDGTHAVAAEAPHGVAADGTHAVAGDGTHAVAADGTYAVAGDGSHKVTADRRARACAAAAARQARRGGPGPPRTVRAFRTQAVRKNYKVSTRPLTTLPLSPRVLKCPFSLPALNAQLTSSGVLMAVFRVCGNGDYGIC
jgi:hypothetical protein